MKDPSGEGGSATDYSKGAAAEIREAIQLAQTPSDWQPAKGPTEWSFGMRVRIVNGPRVNQRGTIRTVIRGKEPGCGQFGVQMDDGSKIALQPLYLEPVGPGSPKAPTPVFPKPALTGKGHGKHALSQSAPVSPKHAPQKPQPGQSQSAPVLGATASPFKHRWERYLADQGKWVPIITIDGTDIEQLRQHGGGPFETKFGSYVLRRGAYPGSHTATWHQIHTDDLAKTWQQGARMATVRRVQI